jgi:starvation-inducible outer membrane lipoprotein
MTISRSIPRNAAAALCAATFALGLAACGSAPTDAGTTQTTHTTPAPALTKVDASTTQHDSSHEPRCFPGKRCQ